MQVLEGSKINISVNAGNFFAYFYTELITKRKNSYWYCMEKTRPKIDSSWYEVLQDAFDHESFHQLKAFLTEEKKKHVIFPPGSQIFSAFDAAPFDHVKVVILGQDPYHGPGQAHGLCFSVNEGIAFPPSLINIFKELQQDIGMMPPKHGKLESWAQQGVLLLNTVLTVRQHEPESHKNKGWERFTDEVIRQVALKREHVVFLLWGNNAKAKIPLIDTSKHLVLTAAHPSPLSASRGFFGCRHFSKTNDYLIKNNIEPINWQL